MKRLWIIMLGSLLILLAGVGLSRGAEEAPPLQGSTPPPNLSGRPSEPAANNHKVAYRLDFSDYRGGPLETWLESKGFKFEEAAKNPDALKLSVQDGATDLRSERAVTRVSVQRLHGNQELLES